jgi:hypothetical protein
MKTDEQVNSLLSLMGVCEGGPSDLADSHDQYLRVSFVRKNFGEKLMKDGLNCLEVF